MSLLMDALKKAEREREAQASKEQGESDATLQELSLDPMEAQSGEEPDLLLPADSDEPWDILGEDSEAEPSFDLDFNDVDAGADELDNPEPPPLTREAPSALRDVPLSVEEGEEISLEDTSSTLPSMKAVKASVDRYFDGTQSASISMAAVVPGVEQDDATTVMRVRDTEEARAAARTVFDAKDRRKRKGWIWIPVGLLFFLLLTGGFVFAYYTEYGGGVADLIALVTGKPAPIITASAPESATSQTTTGTVVASTSDGLETSSGANDGGAASVGVETTVATQTAELVIESDATIESLEPELTAVMELEPPPVGDLTPVEESSAEVPTLGPAVSESLPSAQELLASADEQISAAMANQNTNATTAGQAEDFQLTRGPVVPRVNANVLNGYEAFQRNDLATAERSYRDALRTEPNNRDALLGLAAIAVKKDHVGLASQVYREILRVDPRDSIAQSALMSLTSNPTTSNESQLKLMLEREPEAGHLHFGLGNYYASQARWAEAQNSYFNAFRLDNDNPDYAYNLAIGLDHLAQRQAAVKYYRLALELAGDQLPGFEQAVVQKRIESITQ